MNLRRTVYQSLPEGLQGVAQHGYMLLVPGLSWRKWRHTKGDFVERFFDDREEYDRYAEEFWTSDIVDICRAASASAGEDTTIWDAHRDESERLYALLRKRRPETIVETGVYHGISTASMLVALDANDAGTLYSIDNSAEVDRASSRTDGGTATVGPHLERPLSGMVEEGHEQFEFGGPEELIERMGRSSGRRGKVLAAAHAKGLKKTAVVRRVNGLQL
jgi:hypothetical protein